VYVAIRADASLDIGTGHVMRCLTLAGVLRKRGAVVLFLCREHAGNLCDFVEERGYSVARLPPFAPEPGTTRAATQAAGWRLYWRADADQTRAAMELRGIRPDLLVVDHYGLNGHWEAELRPVVRRIFVLDDLADRSHDCDVLLDQSLHDSPESRYVGLVKESTRVFVGPRYALLRPEFDDVAIRLRDLGLRQLLVFFGGTDPSNEALKLVSALRVLGTQAPLTRVVLGTVNPHREAVCRAAEGFGAVEIIQTTNQMAKLMAEADLGIGTCGGAAWERCVLGLPSLVVVTAECQRDDARILHKLGAVRNLGDGIRTSVELWVAEIRALQNDPAALRDMSRAAATVMHGREEALRDLEGALVA
jgi:UDP-2,4-diacetamido-2,4,6-trideoxy-beta-L-altropyranose hydrolase